MMGAEQVLGQRRPAHAHGHRLPRQVRQRRGRGVPRAQQQAAAWCPPTIANGLSLTDPPAAAACVAQRVGKLDPATRLAGCGDLASRLGRHGRERRRPRAAWRHPRYGRRGCNAAAAAAAAAARVCGWPQKGAGN